jgi:hypothetical protein
MKDLIKKFRKIINDNSYDDRIYPYNSIKVMKGKLSNQIKREASRELYVERNTCRKRLIFF